MNQNIQVPNIHPFFQKPGTWLFLIVFIILFFSAMSSFYTVGPDEEAVVIRLGKYHESAQPGLHFKLTLGIDSVYLIQTTKIHQLEFGFRTVSTAQRRTRYAQKGFDDESLMLTGDLNVADVEWVVQYKISDPFKYLFKTAEPIQNLRDISESIMRRVVGDQLVTDVITIKRREVADEAKELMQKTVDKYDFGVFIVSVKLQDVNPPEIVKPSFNELNAAKQEQEKLINEAEERYNKVIPEARGKALKVISKAEGYAAALVNRSKGDAQKFKEIAKEYKRSPKVTKRRLYLETMENVLKKVERIEIVDPDIKGLLPIYNQVGK